MRVQGIAQTTPSTVSPCKAVSSPSNGHIPVDLDNWRFPGWVVGHGLHTYTSLNTTEGIRDMYLKITKIKLNKKKTLGNKSCLLPCFKGEESKAPKG